METWSTDVYQTVKKGDFHGQSQNNSNSEGEKKNQSSE